MPAVLNVITGNGTVPTGGTTGQQLTKNSNTNYDVGWAAAGSGGGTPGGSTTQVQFNDAGAFQGDAGMVYAKTIPKLTLSGGATIDSRLVVGTLEFQPYALNNCWLGDNVYFDAGGFKYRATGAAGMFYFYGPEGQFRFAASGTGGTACSANIQFKVNSTGSVALGGSITATAGSYTGAQLLVTPASGVSIPSGSPLLWSSTTDASAASDTALSRNGAGIVEVNSGTLGTYRDLRLRKLLVDTAAPGYMELSGSAGAVDIRNSAAASRSILEVMPRGTVALIPAAFQFFGTDYIADSANYEMLAIYSKGSSDTNYRIFTVAAGTGVRRPLSISANGTDTQFVLSTTGPISVGTSITGSGTVPTGGATNQVLAKTSATDYALGWITPAGGGNVSNSGTPTALQYGRWVTATTIEGVATSTVKTDLALNNVTNDAQIKSSDFPGSATDSQVVLFSGTTGKVVKAAAGTGIPKHTAGVLGIATPDTDYAAALVTQDIGDVTTTITTGVDVVRLTTVLTAARTLTLPPAASYNAQHQLMIVDPKQVCSGGFQLFIVRTGTDTVNGGTSSVGVLIAANAGSTIILTSDGVSAWRASHAFSGYTGSGKVLQASSAGASWTTMGFPTSTYSAGKIIVSDGTNWVGSVVAYPNATAPAAGKIIVADGTNWVASTPAFPNASATSRKKIVSNGTDWIASNETWAVPGTSGNVLTSDGTNWLSSQNTAWDGIVKVSGSDFTTTATGSTGITGLTSAILTASTLYEFELVLLLNSSDTSGLSIAMDSANSASTVWFNGTATLNTATGTASIGQINRNQLTATFLTQAVDGVAHVKGFFKCGATTAAALIAKIAKTTAGTATVRIGSCLKWRLA